MTIDPQDLPTRRGPRAGRAGQAAAELEPLVDGPVHAPHSAEAAVELAVDPAVAALPRLLAVVGATSTADVAAAVGWATMHDVGVVALDPRPHRPALATAVPTAGSKPVLAVSRSRIDGVHLDRAAWTLRAGVGASWPAVYRAAPEEDPAPRTLLHRPGLVAHGVGSVTKRGVVLVTGDGTVHHLGAGSGDPELWWAYRAQPERVGILTEVVLDPWDTTMLQRRTAWSAGERMRFADVMRRHDPFGTLTRSIGQSG
ncbi:FAD-dependent oxidoreductase [Actinomycetospora soli]|uniref:FAD-dependent oxidoreductase n=1 Tax=Actinomycetospora soli TaxID=2893887 RepID=UPI001E409198|nr:FAD-dependent oxidoreductase [Actinomycetospora soli]MCD2187118.1 FAD-dependent oxidoreductase [Actinomycetospora soli]